MPVESLERSERDLIQRRKLHEEVALRIEEMIHSGRYAVGAQLPSERELMERFGVGRPSVREALLLLQNMGLVALNSGERARVTAPTPHILVGQLSGAARHLLAQKDGVRHFQGARVLFEAALARHAAEHATDADLAQLAAALEDNRRALGNLKEFERTDVAFHYVLAVIPRNPIFTALHVAMVEWLTGQRTVSLRNRGADAGAYAAHDAIYRAIAARDAEAADRAMRSHLGEVSQLYWRIMDEVPSR